MGSVKVVEQTTVNGTTSIISYEFSDYADYIKNKEYENKLLKEALEDFKIQLQEAHLNGNLDEDYLMNQDINTDKKVKH